MARFSFGSKKAKKKAAKPTPPKIELTEEQVSEDNPELKALIEPPVDKNKERLKRENALTKLKSNDLNETHHYVCVVFQSWKQKMEFLAQIPNVLCVDDVFIDGETFAHTVGKPVTPNELPPVDSVLNKKLAELAKIPRE